MLQEERRLKVCSGQRKNGRAMQPYVPQSTALPPPTAANRPIDPNVQTLVGQLLMAQQQQPAPAPGQELQGVDGEPIRPEATRALAQVLGATSQAGAQNLLQMTGWGNTNEASVQAVMQLLAGNPQMYGAELSRQLAAGAGPYNIQAAQGSMDAGNSGARADSGSAGAAGKPEDNQALTEEALHLKRIQATQEKNRRNQRKYRERQKAKISSSEQQIKDLMDKAEALERQNEHLNARNRELEVAAHVAAQNAAAAGGPEAAAAARQKEVFQALARFCSQVSGEAISEEQVKHFRFRDWRRFTQAYQDRLAQLFARGSDLDIKTRTELASLVGAKHEAERQAWTHTPQAIHKHYALQACLLPTNTTLTPPTLAGWQAILAELQLSPDQEQRLLSTREAILGQVQAISAERQRISAALQAASPSLSQDMQQLEAHVLTSCATEGLAKNMQREDQLIFALLHTFWEVATPVQAARADQLCFPHLPDVLAMCSVLSRGQQQLPFNARTKVEQSIVDAASAALPMPGLEELLDAQVFKEGALGLYFSP
ncbi:hypothetical protein COCOBI_05-4420 [Coccomyxa sp. Obi]|nr:hypothetical protein COCOBI_05-4420 [Coccomyxa sp. Obi]